MADEMKGHVVLVTGAGSGIGRATAILMANAGGRIGVADINREAAELTANTIAQAGGEAVSLVADVADGAQVRQMVERLVDRFGTLDVAVNNAAIVSRSSLLVDVADDEWDRSIAVNLTGVRNCMKTELEIMRRRGKGAIVNISSGAGLRAIPYSSSYTAGKHGIIGLTRTAAKEHVKEGIRINAICPGFVDTPIHSGHMPADGDPRDTSDWLPMGRAGRPEEIAEAVLWLASDKASFVTGVALPVDGGWQA